MLVGFLMGELAGVIMAMVWFAYKQDKNREYEEDIRTVDNYMRNKIAVRKYQRGKLTAEDEIEITAEVQGMCEMLSIYEDYFDDVIHKELED